MIPIEKHLSARSVGVILLPRMRWAALAVGFVMFLLAPRSALAQVLFLDTFQQFASGADLTATTYVPASGPASASVTTSVQNGSPKIRATNMLGSIWALFDNSVVTNKNQYKATLASVQTNQQLRVTWRMWIQATNTGPGMFLFSVPVLDPTPGVTFNPPLAFLDTGVIVAITNGTGPLTTIGNWGSLAGTPLTNTLILDYRARTFSYALNGQSPVILPLGPYFTNVVGAVYFNGFERSPGSVGNRFALDDLKVEVPPPSFSWAKRIATTTAEDDDDELAVGLAIDNAANLYVTGWFDGINDFGGGTFLTNKPGGGQDLFVAKYNSSGSLQWARRAGSDTTPAPENDYEGRDAGRAIGVDSAGNVYVTGGVFSNADFGPFTVSAPTNKEFFLAKYNSAGVVQWVQQSVGGNGIFNFGWDDGVYGLGLAVDSAGNCYAVGFAANVTSAGSPIKFGTFTLTNSASDGASTFLVKYNSAGVVQWLKALTSSNQCYTTSVCLDKSGSVYVAGEFRSRVTIEGTTFITTGEKDGYVAKFNTNGVLQWARQMTGASDGGALAVAAGPSGAVYVVGGFGNSISNTICFGSICLTNTGAGVPGTGIGDAFLAKYNAAGTPQWARRAGGPDLDGYTGVTVDSLENIYVGGASGGTGLPTGFNAIIAKYDTNGLLQWTQSSTGTNGAIAFGGPVLDPNGNSYIAGWFQTEQTFGTHSLTGLGVWDFFLAKLGDSALSLKAAWTNSLALLSVTGASGTRFALEFAPSLPGGGTWQPLFTNALGSLPFVYSDASSPGKPSRFYRARIVP